MSYSAGPGVLNWHSIDTANSGPLQPQSGGSTGVAWPTENLAIYVPIVVRVRSVVTSLWYANHTTATGNYDIGLYDAAGTALLRRGSTAKTSSQSELVWDCTDTTIGPGIYYLALVSSNNTDLFSGFNTTAPMLTSLGLFTEASALPLPATATFAITQTLAFMPIVGMLLNTLVT